MSFRHVIRAPCHKEAVSFSGMPLPIILHSSYLCKPIIWGFTAASGHFRVPFSLPETRSLPPEIRVPRHHVIIFFFDCGAVFPVHLLYRRVRLICCGC